MTGETSVSSRLSRVSELEIYHYTLRIDRFLVSAASPVSELEIYHCTLRIDRFPISAASPVSTVLLVS